jgi:thiamine biosynthesis lipoprotein
LYRPGSEIARVNARAAHEAVRVSPMVFQLLEDARRLSRDTAGAFDITIAPLVRCWGFMNGTGRLPEPDQVERARACVGMERIELDAAALTVRFDQEGVMLDLGAIGKGYALGRAVELLREAGVTSALIHGGTSTVYGLGHPPGQEFWKVAVEYPAAGPAAPPRLLAAVPLRDEAMSVSAVWGRSFQAEGKVLGHVLDPRTGRPVAGACLSAVVLPSAMATDALSTGLLVLGEGAGDALAARHPGLRALVLRADAVGGGWAASSRGIELRPL